MKFILQVEFVSGNSGCFCNCIWLAKRWRECINRCFGSISV